MSEESNRRAKLSGDLQTRVLTNKEMAEVLRTGSRLFEPYGPGLYSYDPIETQKKFNEAILQQTRLRMIHDQHEAKG